MSDGLSKSTSTPEVDVRKRKARLTFMAIVAVFVLPFVVMPLFFSLDHVGRNNKGTLIQPHIPMAELKLEQVQGGTFNVEQLQSRWTLLYVLPNDCRQTCIDARNHALYAMRQVRLSMDRQVDRVQQLLVFTQMPDETLSALIQQEFPSMLQARGSNDVLDKILVDGSEPAGKIYLMSPDGYIFMSYPTFVDEKESVLRARDIRADLKKSLKGDRNL